MYGYVYGMIRLRKLPHNCQVMKENLIFFHTNNIDHTPATASDFMWSNFIYTANSAHASNQHHCLLLLFPSFFFPIHFRIVVLAAKWNWNCRSLRLVRQGTEKKNVYWLLRFVELKLWHVHRSFRIYICSPYWKQQFFSGSHKIYIPNFVVLIAVDFRQAFRFSRRRWMFFFWRWRIIKSNIRTCQSWWKSSRINYLALIAHRVCLA